MGAEPLPHAVVRPLAEQVQVEITQDLPESIRVDDVARGGAFADAEAIAELLRGVFAERDCRLEQARGTFSLHPEHAVGRDKLHVGRGRLQCPDD